MLKGNKRCPRCWNLGSVFFSLSLLSERFAQNCSAQTTHNLVDNTDSVLPVIVMQMLMDSEVLWLAWCGLISLLYGPQRAQSAFSLSPLLIEECWVVFFCLAGLADRQQQPGYHGLNDSWCSAGWMLRFPEILIYSQPTKSIQQHLCTAEFISHLFLRLSNTLLSCLNLGRAANDSCNTPPPLSLSHTHTHTRTPHHYLVSLKKKQNI